MVWEFESKFVIIIPEWYPSVNYFHLCQWCSKLYVKATILFLLCMRLECQEVAKFLILCIEPL